MNPHPYANLIGWGIVLAVLMVNHHFTRKATLEKFGKAFNEYWPVLRWMLWLQMACIVASFFLFNTPASAIGAIFLFANIALWWAVVMLLCARPHPHLLERAFILAAPVITLFLSYRAALHFAT